MTCRVSIMDLQIMRIRIMEVVIYLHYHLSHINLWHHKALLLLDSNHHHLHQLQVVEDLLYCHTRMMMKQMLGLGNTRSDLHHLWFHQNQTLHPHQAHRDYLMICDLIGIRDAMIVWTKMCFFHLLLLGHYHNLVIQTLLRHLGRIRQSVFRPDNVYGNQPPVDILAEEDDDDESLWPQDQSPSPSKTPSKPFKSAGLTKMVQDGGAGSINFF
jgi:hypothetical protein